MKKILFAIAALCILSAGLSLAEMQAVINPFENGLNRIEILSVIDPEGKEENADILQSVSDMMEKRLRQTNAQSICAKAVVRGKQNTDLTIEQTAEVWNEDGMVSAGVFWNGEQPDGKNGSSIRTCNFYSGNGKEIFFADLFSDAEGAAAYMEKVIADELEDFSDYMEYSELLPMPTDSFYLNEQGITICYNEDRYRYYDGTCGSFQFPWFELAGFLKEDSPFIKYCGSDTIQKEQIFEAAAKGSLGGVFGEILDTRLGDILEKYTLLNDPDYTEDSYVYFFRAPELRGWNVEIPKYAETEEPETPVSAVRTKNANFYGLHTGKTTIEEVTSTLGEPDNTVNTDESDAQDRMIEPGESLYYKAGEYALEIHFDTDEVLSELILHDTMPES